MAVPKRRTSRSNTRHRRANWGSDATDRTVGLVDATALSSDSFVTERADASQRRVHRPLSSCHSTAVKPAVAAG